MADANSERTVKPNYSKPYTRPKNNPNHTVRKRTTTKTSNNANDVYVTRKSNFKAQLIKCEKLLDEDNGEVVIHGLGAAIQRAINLALQLKEKYQDTCQLDANTSTVSIIDDLEPLTEDADYETQRRFNSAIHIRVFRTLTNT